MKRLLPGAIAAAAMMCMLDVSWAEEIASAASPDGRLAVVVGLDGDGRPDYAVTRDGKPVIAPSRLGFLLADQPKL
jgi:alpha-glucosidase